MAQTKIRSGQLDALPYTCNGRLTLESGVPISTTDQTSGSIVYFTPYKGNYLGLYDGAKWEVNTFTETELDISGFSGSTVYDIFGYDNSGTFALTSGSWSGSAVRDVELTTQDGIYVRTGEEDKRYLGTIYASDAGVCQDTTAQRYVWNYYNKIVKSLLAIDTTDTWNYTTATWRAANNSTVDGVGRFSFVIGVSEDIVKATAIGIARNPTAAVGVYTGIGLDVTNNNNGSIRAAGGTLSGNAPTITSTTLEDYLSIGFHFLQKTEYSIATGTSTWWGDGNQSDNKAQTGMTGEVMG